MDIDHESGANSSFLNLQHPEAYHKLLKEDMNSRSNEQQRSIPNDEVMNAFNSFNGNSKDFKPHQPVSRLHEDRYTDDFKHKKSNHPQKVNQLARKSSRLTKNHPQTMKRLAKKTPLQRSFNYKDKNLAKGYEHIELLHPRPDLTIMVQPSKIDYAGWQNNGGIRLFIHRPLTVPTDPRDAIEINNNLETFLYLEHEDIDLMSGEFQRDGRGCLRRVSRENLWFDLEVELYNPLTYTWDSCIHEWQAKTMFKACKCLPHYYSELFDYWWNKNLRCNHHGLKCMALVNGELMIPLNIISMKLKELHLGTSYMFNSTWGNTHKQIPLQCPSMCGHRQFNATIKSQSSLGNDSWFVQWLQSKGNRLFDLKNQLTKPYFKGSPYDYSLMKDHKRHLMNDTSVLHFYFDALRTERKRGIDPAPSPSICSSYPKWLIIFMNLS